MSMPSIQAGGYRPKVAAESAVCAGSQGDGRADVHGKCQPRPTRREISSFWERVERFERENVEAACIVASDPARYGGGTAGLVRWARMTLERSGMRAAA
jgi:hypothetical protein